jgi:CBS domain-containing protein
MTAVMDFKEVKSNFIKAARTGKDSMMHWMGRSIPVQELLKNELLPIAKEGLEKAGVDKEDIKKYLGIIKKRIKKQTASEWIIKNYRILVANNRKDNALRLLTRAIYKNQKKNIPVHRWPAIKPDGYLKDASHLVSHIMSTQLFTVRENDLATLATTLMKWKDIHHVPVENEKGELCGLLTWTHAQKFLNQEKDEEDVLVSSIMQREVITTESETHIKDAIKTMKKHEIGCLPVVHNRDLVGIITIKDVILFDD